MISSNYPIPTNAYTAQVQEVQEKKTSELENTPTVTDLFNMQMDMIRRGQFKQLTGLSPRVVAKKLSPSKVEKPSERR